MTLDRFNEESQIGGQPVWHRPTLTSVVIAEVTMLGKLGSEVDLGAQDNNYSPD